MSNWVHTLTQNKLQLLSLISHYLPWQILYNGSGHYSWRVSAFCHAWWLVHWDGPLEYNGGCLGWTSALTESKVASSGKADSFLKVSHLARTRHAHQVTLLTLWKLQKVAFLQSGSNQSEETWRNDVQKRSLTFMHWRYETLILTFVWAHREKNFMWRSWHLISLHWIIIMQDSCLSTLEKWSTCTVLSMMSLKSIAIESYQRLIKNFQ